MKIGMNVSTRPLEGFRYSSAIVPTISVALFISISAVPVAVAFRPLRRRAFRQSTDDHDFTYNAQAAKSGCPSGGILEGCMRSFSLWSKKHFLR
jgi:hypothetical protein